MDDNMVFGTLYLVFVNDYLALHKDKARSRNMREKVATASAWSSSGGGVYFVILHLPTSTPSLSLSCVSELKGRRHEQIHSKH